MRSVVVIVLAVLAIGCKEKKTVAKLERNEAAVKYASTISAADLEKHLSVLASDEYEGRETGRAGQKKAAKYLVEYYRNIGIKGGMTDETYQQSFPLDVQNPKNIKLIQVEAEGSEHAFTLFDDFYFFSGFADTLIENAPMVFMNYGIDDEKYTDYKTTDVAGKVVLVLDGEPDIELEKDWDNWRLKMKAARKKGAVAIVMVKKNFDKHSELMRYYLNNPSMQLHNKGNKKYDRIPNFYISEAAAKKMTGMSKKELKEKADKLDGESITCSAKFTIHSYMRETDVTSENILAFIEGTDLKEEILVISAHYDHIGYDNGEICNGADDDGSGTVAVLEIAQAFAQAKKEGNGPRRSILFLNVSGEEKGLLGSQYYTENPIYPLKNTITNLNIDMIGRIDEQHIEGKKEKDGTKYLDSNSNYTYIIGSDRLSMDLHNISESANATYTEMELDYTYNDPSDPNRFYERSDHYNFAKNNIPVIFYFSGVHEDYHKPTDDVEKIMFPKMERITRLVFHTAWELVNQDIRPQLNAK